MTKPAIGLVGGIGSGKSEVARLLSRRGARIIAGDRLGHEALDDEAVRQQLLARWSRSILKGEGEGEGEEIDRGRLGKIVFAAPDQRRALEALTHPYIERRFHEEIAAAEKDDSVSFVVLDAALLYEAGWHRFCDCVVYVHAPRNQRLQRVAAQRGWTAKEVEARECAQWSLTDKVSRCKLAIENLNSTEQLNAAVDALLRQLPLPQARGSALE